MVPFAPPINTSPCFEDGAPLFGARCDIAIRVPEGESGEAYYMKLLDDGSRECSNGSAHISNQDFVLQVARGARTSCRVAHSGETCPDDPGPDDAGYCVESDTGNRSKWALEGLQGRVLGGAVSVSKNCPDSIPGEGECDAMYGPDFGTQDGIDQWWEALYVLSLGPGVDPRDVKPGPKVTFEKRDCEAPRLVTLILIDEYDPTGNPQYPIRGFAGFILEGCRDEDDVFNPWCLTKNEEKDYGSDRGPYLSNTGHIYMEGTFINYVDIGGPGGPATPYGRMQLYMVE